MAMVRTTHIQQMLMEALELAQVLDAKTSSQTVLTAGSAGQRRTLEETLSRAVNLATHAAAEMEDERQRLLGWT